MGHGIENDRRTAHVGYTMLGNQVENESRIKLAEADMSSSQGTHSPSEAPTVAVKHRKRPEESRFGIKTDHHRIAQCSKVGTTMMKHHSLWVSGGTRSVVQADGIPFVIGQTPFIILVSFFKKGFIINGSQPLPTITLSVVKINN